MYQHFLEGRDWSLDSYLTGTSLLQPPAKNSRAFRLRLPGSRPHHIKIWPLTSEAMGTTGETVYTVLLSSLNFCCCCCYFKTLSGKVLILGPDIGCWRISRSWTQSCHHPIREIIASPLCWIHSCAGPLIINNNTILTQLTVTFFSRI